MICKNCNREISDNIEFCGFCGSPTGVSENKSASETYTPGSFWERFAVSFTALGSSRYLLVCTLVLLLLNPILAAFKLFNISASWGEVKLISLSYSFFDFLNEMAEDLPVIYFLAALGIALIIAAALLMLLPLFKGKKYSTKYVLLTKIMSIVAFVVLTGWYILMYASSNDQNLDSIAPIKMTFFGVLLILDNIALVITSFKFSHDVKFYI